MSSSGSRAPKPAGSDGSSCIWERWREAGRIEGTRVREGLRNGVEQALLTLGEGFLQHPANEALRSALHDGRLSQDAYFQQLLRLIYRLIFVFTVEERGVLHTPDDSAPAVAARRAYAEGYALNRLRDLCLKRRARNRRQIAQVDRQIWQGRVPQLGRRGGAGPVRRVPLLLSRNGTRRNAAFAWSEARKVWMRANLFRFWFSEVERGFPWSAA